MHLFTIFAFAFVFWRHEGVEPWTVIGGAGAAATLVFVFAQPVFLGLLAFFGACVVRQMLRGDGKKARRAHGLYHRVTLALRLALIIGFGLSVFATPWPDWFALGDVAPSLQILGDVVILLPYFAGAVAVWLGSYPFERTVRQQAASLSPARDSGTWRLSTYLDFNIRHHLLVVAVPLAIILYAANMVRAYDEAISGAFGWALAPDLVLGAAAACVFIAAPLMLRRIWRTTPLGPGPVRSRLEALCERIGLRCRQILVWQSDGYMINAAVMGVFAPVRYVLLSDALLATMTPAQIEAVFGHEAGHVRHHHIPHFLAFAAVGWFIVVGVMELMARTVAGPDGTLAGMAWTVETAGIAGTVLFWGVGFGWVSRRFERQADLHGARCAAPLDGQCSVPCSVHLDDHTTLDPQQRLCATGAAVFASALERVAVLNGIPPEERSWRHSSIASRVRFLLSAAGDPERALGLERQVRRIKLSIWSAAVLGTALTVWYWSGVGTPALMRLQNAGG